MSAAQSIEELIATGRDLARQMEETLDDLERKRIERAARKVADAARDLSLNLDPVEAVVHDIPFTLMTLEARIDYARSHRWPVMRVLQGGLCG